MRITGHVADQKVFGNYGPASPSTILATLLDGTGSNMLLQETAADRPAELILTPRTGGPTPPSPQTAASSANDDEDGGGQQIPYGGGMQSPLARPGMPPYGQPNGMQGGNGQPSMPGMQPGSTAASPQPLTQPNNNVNGSPFNRSPTASTYPTTNSVPLDNLATPSTTPPVDGIVDSPNPPPAGSDTAAALNGAPAGTPGTTNINPAGTNQTVPGNTTDPNNPGQQPATLTPEQIFLQLQQRQQQQTQQQQETSPQ